MRIVNAAVHTAASTVRSVSCICSSSSRGSLPLVKVVAAAVLPTVALIMIAVVAAGCTYVVAYELGRTNTLHYQKLQVHAAVYT
jgi:hypothetical protein